ncbi:MAG: hypothetical protein IT443_13645 [Phycisphaeraceae bacterium]|nr:hypothetical protein [Phycisphaeraceae bacterium]
MKRNSRAICGWIGLAACLLAAAACTTRSTTTSPSGATGAAGRYSYRQLAERYNARAAVLDRLWTRAQVELKWKDAEGKSRFESGEGHLIYLLPGRVALEVGKVGQTGLWAGSDQERYWIFDLKAEPPTVRFGRHDLFDAHREAKLGLPVAPNQLPLLLGVAPIDLAAGEGTVDRESNSIILTPPAPGSPAPGSPGSAGSDTARSGHWVGENRYRIWLSGRTLEPWRVELLDERGQVVVYAELSNPQRVRVAGLASKQWPRLASRMRIYLRDRQATLTLKLEDARGGEGEDRIRARQFDFEFLVNRQFKIPPEQRIDLDAGSDQ